MAITGTITAAQGTQTISSSAYDQLTVTVSSGTYSVEYPIGTVIANGVTTTASYQLGGGGCRITVNTGSVGYSLEQIDDNLETQFYKVLTDAEFAILVAGSGLTTGVIYKVGTPEVWYQATSASGYRLTGSAIPTYTSAQLSAMALAGTLTPLATYVASDDIYKTEHRATSASTLVRSVSWAFPNGGPSFEQSAEPWLVQPGVFDGNPKQDGSLGSVGVTKDRILQWAGMPDRLVVNGVSRIGGTVQWGTEHAADANYVGSAIDNVYTVSPGSIESSGSAWLKFRDNVDGSQEVAMGRIKKFPDGRLRMMHKLDDALISSCPRIQMFGGALINQQGYYRIYISPQFGDVDTPWPAYVAGRDTTLFFQVKGGAGQPIISLNVEHDAPTSDTMKVFMSLKPTNAGAATQVASVTGLAKGVRHDIVIDTRLDWTSAGYIGLWINGRLIYSATTNTLMSDFADQVTPMWGLYRYQYSGAKAPDDCAIIFHLAGVKNGLTPLA